MVVSNFWFMVIPPEKGRCGDGGRQAMMKVAAVAKLSGS
jgi:hypothetical protein